MIGVNVNAIVPGYIATDMNTALIKDIIRSKQILDRIPADRWGEPDNYKGTVIYLASGAPNYVHGQLVAVDGGWLGR
ncbi:SDR family oxidoreductase [Rossellomorea vietnamensis]|uniref:SDR family oxidoreductase n=1 Tax=Rossellomorea vietnamensis TaxID=218284 RepID=UPI003F7E2A65